MPEDLQGLIDRLQREAVDEGERRARAIVVAAERRAAELLQAADAEATRRVAWAERDAATFVERGARELERAGRDLLIAVRQSVERLLTGLLHESLEAELRPELLAELLVAMAGAYAGRSGRERRMAVLVGPDDLDELVRLYARRYRDELVRGVELRLDPSVERGFRVALVDEHVEHDFTIDAIAEALTDHLRPRLAQILTHDAPALAAGRAR